MFICENIIKFHLLSPEAKLEKVHKLHTRRKELKFENLKRKASKKRKSKTKVSKESKMLSMLTPEMQALFLKG